MPTLATIAVRTRGFSNGRRAAGSDRRTSGRSRNTSASFAGPRRIGFSTSAERKRFEAEATCSTPSGRLTAHAQAVGPWTRTPFASAIPPRRIFSVM